jgi:serine/threonine-protein kinase
MSDPITLLNEALASRYRILSQLGEGGTATVYLADDLRHERKVALKVLKPELAAVVGAERFLAEIKTTANLQHPHILPLFDSGVADGFLFYVMPYVGGESLRDKLDRERQLAVDEAVRIATNVAEALDYAHRHGVIHRDIKPANILLQDGKPVMSDFGIALAISTGGAGRLTETGLSLGTPHYMSPEQATGDQTVGPATDIYALGCVLYEMLVAEPPYTGGTPQAVLGKIVTGEPDPVTKRRRSCPSNVDAAIRRALEKVPADRFATAAEFSRALADRVFTHGDAALVGGGVRGGTWNPLSAAMTGVAAIAVALAVWGRFARPGAELAVTTRAEIVGLDLSIPNGGWRLAISPDGRSIVAGHVEEGAPPALYVRSADDPEWRRLPGTENGTNPSFSPDGRWVAFDVGNTGTGILKVSIAGGPPLPIVATGGSPHWTADDQIVYNAGGDILSVSAAGGEPRLLFHSDSIAARRPYLLPNGSGVVFGTGQSTDSRIMLFDLEGGALRELVAFGNHPRYVPTGHLIYGHGDGALMAVAFDLETLEVTGAPVTVVPALTVYGGGAALFAVSETGTLIYEDGAGSTNENRTLLWVDRGGREEPIGAPPQEYFYPRLSPDGARAAIQVGAGARSDILVWDFAGQTPQRLILGDDSYADPVWTPDGARIAYGAASGGLLWKASNNTGMPELLADLGEGRTGARRPSPYFFTPDGSALVVRDQASPATRDDLVMLSLEGDSVVWRLEGPFYERNAALSPNGRWMAYASDESGQYEIYVRPFPDVHQDQVRVSNNTGFDPVWSRDGGELFYLEQGENPQLMAVTVETGRAAGSFGYRDRRVVMSWPYYALGEGRSYDTAPDGRFLAIRPDPGTSGTAHVWIVTNWFAELRARMGG